MNKNSKPSPTEIDENTQTQKTSRLKRWGKEFVSILLIVGLVSYAMDFYHSSSMPKGVAPAISGMTLEGDMVDVIEMSKSGQPVIVYFWATWCPVCKFVSPTVSWFSDSHEVVTVALSSGRDERVKQFVKAKDYKFSVLNDTSGDISREWNISVTPTIVIIKDGEIKQTSTGITTPWGLWLRTLFI